MFLSKKLGLFGKFIHCFIKIKKCILVSKFFHSSGAEWEVRMNISALVLLSWQQCWDVNTFIYLNGAREY
jgi:hypothetical protein